MASVTLSFTGTNCTPSRSSYVFNYMNGTGGVTVSRSGTTLTCAWTAISGASSQITVTLTAGSATGYTYGTPYWYATDMGTYTSAKTIRGMCSRSAKTYTYNFGGTTQSVVYGNIYTAPTISNTTTSTGYSSTFYDYDGTQVGAAKYATKTTTTSYRWKYSDTAYISSGGSYTAQWALNANFSKSTLSSSDSWSPTSITTPAAPSRSGYTFNHWCNGNTKYSANQSINSSSFIWGDYTAEYSRNTATVTFNSNGGSYVAPVSIYQYSSFAGDGKTLPTSTRNYYTFNGWWYTTPGGEEIQFTANSTVSSNMTVNAHWTAISYQWSLSYEKIGGSGGPQDVSGTVSGGPKSITIPQETPTKAGYGFKCWNTFYGTGTDYYPGDTITMGIDTGWHRTLYAQYKSAHLVTITNDKTGVSSTTTYYTGDTVYLTREPQYRIASGKVTYDLDGGSGSYPNQTTYVQYTNNGWTSSVGSFGPDDSYVIKETDGNITFTTRWASPSYSYVTIPSSEPVKNMAIFKCWSTSGGDLYGPNHTITGNGQTITLTAQWVYKNYVSISSSNVNLGTVSPSVIAIPDGWNYSKNDNQIHLSYSRSFTYANGTTGSINVSGDSLATPVYRVGVFNDWIVSATNRTIIASFGPYVYSVVYKENNCIQGHPQDVTDAYTTQSYTIRSLSSLHWTPLQGRTFLHWNTRSDGQGTIYRSDSSVTMKDLTLYCICELKAYEIKFCDGLTLLDLQKTVYAGGKLGILPSASKQNYKFIEWRNVHGVPVDANTNVDDVVDENGNIYLYARFEPLIRIIVIDPNSLYSIYFYNGVYYSTNIGTNTILKVSVPTAQGRIFEYYYDNTTSEQTTTAKGSFLPSSSYTPSHDTIWKPRMADAYTVGIYTSNNTLGSIRLEYTIGSTTFTYTTPGKYTIPKNASYTITAIPNSGYTFSRWQVTGVISSIYINPYTTTATFDATYTAYFDTYHVYVYSEDSNGTVCTSSSPSGTGYGRINFKSGDSVTVRAYPKTNYAFMGWFENGVLVSSSAVYTFTTTNRNYHLTAKFRMLVMVTKQPYGIGSYTRESDDQGTEVPVGSGKFYYRSGDLCHLKASPTYAGGYTFSKWSSTATNMNSSTVDLRTSVDQTSFVYLSYKGQHTCDFQVKAVYDVQPEVEGRLYGSGLYEWGTRIYFGVVPPSGYSVAKWSREAYFKTSSGALILRIDDVVPEYKGSACSISIDEWSKATYTAHLVKSSAYAYTDNRSESSLSGNIYYRHRGYNKEKKSIGYNPAGPGLNPLENGKPNKDGVISSCYGMCTWQTWGRVAEMLGRDLDEDGTCSNFHNAGNWYHETNMHFVGWEREGINNGVPTGGYISHYGQGDILCYGNHVEVVECVYENGDLGISYSGNLPQYAENPILFRRMSPLAVGERLNGEKANYFQGVIHNPELGSSSGRIYYQYLNLYGATIPNNAGHVYINGYEALVNDPVVSKTGDKLGLEATNTNKTFTQWFDGNSNPQRLYENDGVTSMLVAYYNGYSPSEWVIIKTKVSPTSGGTVSGGGEFTIGSTAVLTATPNIGYRFVCWSTGETDTTISVEVDKNKLITATFVKEDEYIPTDSYEDLNFHYDPYIAYNGKIKLSRVYTDISTYTVQTDLSETSRINPTLSVVITYEGGATATLTSQDGYVWTGYDSNQYVTDIVVSLASDDTTRNALSINSLIVEGIGYSAYQSSDQSVKRTYYYNGTTWTIV